MTKWCERLPQQHECAILWLLSLAGYTRTVSSNKQRGRERERPSKEMWSSFPKCMSKTHFNPNRLCAKSYQISQNVLLLQDIQVATADDLEDRAPGSRGDSAEDIATCKATELSRTHITLSLAHRCIERLVADNSHPVIFNCSLLMYWAATPHTQLSGPQPPWCHTAATESLPNS